MSDLAYKLIDRLWVNELPAIPDEVYDVFYTAVEYISTGFKVLAAFVGAGTMTYLMILLSLVLVMFGLYAAYSLIMFIIRKIPFVNIR